MKKLLLGIAAICASLTMFAQNRENILKIYNWSDYIDLDLLQEFPVWYKAQTGEDIKIIYELYDLNEIMLSKIEKGHDDYDVVCPSDYAIERMLQMDLLLPIDRNFGDTPDYTKNVAPYIQECFKEIAAQFGKDGNDYAVGYMWGTTGIIYNTKYVTKEEASTWDIIRNPKYKGKIFIKDSFRDVYPQILQYLKQEDIKSGKINRHDIALDSSEESIEMVENYMAQVKPLVAGWEADFGKEFMTKEKGWVSFGWSGDAVWAREEAAKIGVPLAYEVPVEGSTVWFDGWVIPKYAKNVKAASYFINFLCMSENAIRNMDAFGYVSAIGTDEVLENRRDTTLEGTVNVCYLFGPGHEAEKLDPIQYPDQSVIDRCAPERDSAERTKYLLEMWARIKGDNVNALTYIAIGVAAVGVIVFLVTGNKKKSKRKKSHRR